MSFNITILDFPLSVSVNKHLVPMRTSGSRFGGARMVKSNFHRQYESECQLWQLKNSKLVSEIKQQLFHLKKEREKNKEPLLLSLDAWVLLPKTAVLTVNNKPAGMDVDNYLKPMKDNLFKILGLNDKHVVRDSIQKVILEDGSTPRIGIRLKETGILDIGNMWG